MEIELEWPERASIVTGADEFDAFYHACGPDTCGHCFSNCRF